jgi:uncharacterized membrane protein YuzA (DUF378 family)
MKSFLRKIIEYFAAENTQKGGDLSMSSTKKWLHIVAFVLVIIGAVNLGIFGIVPTNANGEGFDLIQQLFGFNADVLNVVYILIGASGVYLLATHFKECKVCEARKAAKSV